MKNKKLDPQGFIYFAATDKAFRKKYFAKPGALAKDFDISRTDLATIKKIDFPKLQLELATIESGISKIAQSARGPRNTCHNSHTYNEKPPHRSGVHTNTCKGAARILVGKSLRRVKAG